MSPIYVRRPLVIALLAVASSSCQQTGRDVTFPPGTSAILPENIALKVARPCSREVPANVTGAWTPDREQVAAMEAQLAPALRRALAELSMADSVRPKVMEYYRQFVGIVSGGKKIIYVSGFHSSYLSLVSSIGADTTAWRFAPVYVCDGGSGYFGAEFDPDTGKLGPIYFNGYA